MNPRLLNLAVLAVSVMLISACGSDAIDSDSEPSRGDGQRVETGSGGDTAMAAAIADSFIKFEDGDDIEISEIRCFSGDIPGWYGTTAWFHVPGDSSERPFRLEVAGALEPKDNTELLVILTVPERPGSEHNMGHDQFNANRHLFDANTRFEISTGGSNGAMRLARASHPVIGSPMPQGLERHVEFTIACP